MICLIVKKRVSNMELIYYWINRDKCIQEQGFNFSTEYSILMKKHGEKYWLSIKETDAFNVFRSDVITNITAIVGENGTGKTTFLHNLMRLNCYPADKIDEDEYADFDREKNERNKNLIILRNEDGELSIYTNLCKNNLSVADNYKENENLFFISNDNDVAKNNLNYDRAYCSFTKIYISNSYFDDLNWMSAHGKLDGLAITPSRLTIISDAFYEFICPDKMVRTGTESNFNKFSRLVRKIKVSGEFQSICDILFYNFLITSGAIDYYEGVVQTNIVIDARGIFSIIQDAESSDIFVDNKALLDSISSAIAKCYRTDIAKENPVYVLKANLIFEWVLDHDFEIGDVDIETSYEDIVKEIQSGEYSEELYFKNAIDEIENISSILENLKRVTNLVPATDMAYKSGKMTSKAHVNKASEWKELIMFIDSLAKVKRENECQYGSFLLRYLRFDNLKFSSGERVFQNLMSWIYFLSRLDEYTLKKETHTKNNLLICMDEVDISLHPSWQRDFVGIMMNLINRCYTGKKVQIVMTTHSPLCLSNIPRGNIVYLRKSDNRTIVDECKHVETFGTNLYEILDDAYYLDCNSIGSFVKNYIQNIIEGINKVYFVGEKEYSQYKRKISCIGDKLIRNKLEMLLSHKREEPENKEKDMEFK